MWKSRDTFVQAPSEEKFFNSARWNISVILKCSKIFNSLLNDCEKSCENLYANCQLILLICLDILDDILNDRAEAAVAFHFLFNGLYRVNDR